MNAFISGIDIASLLPFIVACIFGMLVLMMEVLQRQSADRGYLAWVTVIGLVCTAATAWHLLDVPGARVFAGMNYLDGFTQFLTIVYCLAGALTALVSRRYLAEYGVDRGEYYALILFSVAGMIVMTSAADLLTFFLGLEILSIAVYALAAYARLSRRSAEAGMKYFILGAFASGILLYGVALIYMTTGTTNLAELGGLFAPGAFLGDGGDSLATLARNGLLAAAANSEGAHPVLASDYVLPVFVIGVTLVFSAFAFKVAAVPFHFWAPDTYEGAPTPVVGFMAAGVKAAGFAALLRLVVIGLFGAELRMGPFGWVQVLFVLSLLSMVIGNVMAIVQKSVKRMLAYSSIAHAGYILVAFVALGYGRGQLDAGSSVIFYGLAYLFGTVGAFGVLAWFGARGFAATDYDDLNGLGYKHPAMAAAMSLFMLSSAGIPPTAGFVGKFLLFKEAVGAATTGSAYGHDGWTMLIWLVVIGIVASIAGFYYYLKVIVHLYMRKPVREVRALPDPSARFAIAFCVAATILLGLVPGRIIDASSRAMQRMADRPDGVYLAPVEDEPRGREELRLLLPAD